MSFHSADTTAHLQIHLTPAAPPKIRRHCARCKVHQLFVSSGKFRVNAQRKLIDVWLIYRCETCDFTWNHAIHERRPVHDIDACELLALMRNDPILADRHAGDIASQRAAKVEIEAAAILRLERSIIRPVHWETRAIHITISSAAACQMRLDRVLAWGLSLQRREVIELSESAALIVRPRIVRALKRAATNGQQIEINLDLSSPEIAMKCLQSLGNARGDLSSTSSDQLVELCIKTGQIGSP